MYWYTAYGAESPGEKLVSLCAGEKMKDDDFREETKLKKKTQKPYYYILQQVNRPVNIYMYIYIRGVESVIRSKF